MRDKLAGWGVAVILALSGAVAGGEEWACSPWTWEAPAPLPLRLSAVVAQGGAFWGFGPSGVAVSADGLTWQHRTWRNGQMKAVVWTGREFIGVAGNVVAASPDGVSWSVRHEIWQDPIFFTYDLRSIAWNGERFVVVGEDYSGRFSMWSPAMLTSPDGVNWSRGSFPAAADPSHASLSAVVWTGDRFVAVGSYLLASRDGESWSSDETVSGTAVAAGGGIMVVAGDEGIRISRDLEAWEALPTPVSEARLQFLGGRFWLAGRCANCPDHEPSLWSSADGRNWRRERLDDPLSIRGLALAGERLVAVGDGAAVRDATGRFRTRRATLSSGLTALAAGPAALVAVGQRGEILASVGGEAWQRVLWGGAAALADVTWGPAGFVAVGEGVSLVSGDGVAWSRHPSPEGVGLARVVAAGARYLAVDWGTGMYLSEDGVSWARVDLAGLAAPLSFFNDLAVGDGTIVASAWNRDAGGTLLASRDGTTWTKVADTASGLPELAWGGGRFLATDFDKVLASQDGTSWQVVHTGLELVGLQWLGDRFLAWDRDGTCFVSGDGASWQAIRGPGEPATRSVGAALFRLTADGAIQRSTCGPAEPPLWLPSLAHLPGAGGTLWRSDVELHNPGPAPITAGLVATPRGAGVPAAALGLALGPGEARRLDDVLAGWLGIEEAATVVLSSWGGGALAVARTYNAAATGTYGQFIPPQAASVAVPPGGEGRLLLLGHAADRRRGVRTNIGLVAVGDAAVVDVELWRGDGTRLGTLRSSVPAGSSGQLNDVFRAVASGDAAVAYAVVRPDPAGGGVLAYASVVDNVTGDPVLVTPARAVAAGEAAWLPGAGHVTGLGGSVWRTDLELHNPGGDVALAEVDLFPRDQAGGPVASVTVSVPAGASVRLEDVVWTQFRRQGGATLRVRPTRGRVMTAARSYTLSGDGRFGQFVPALSAGDAVTPETPARLLMLRQTGTGGFRTNLGLVNVTALEAVVDLNVLDAAGRPLGRLTRSLGPWASVQLTEALRLVAPAGADDAVAVVATSTPGAAVLAYSCLIDNRTNDPVFVPAQPEPRPAFMP